MLYVKGNFTRGRRVDLHARADLSTSNITDCFTCSTTGWLNSDGNIGIMFAKFNASKESREAP